MAVVNYDALLALMRDRRSIRRFTSRPVNRQQIEQLLEAVSWAPSNHNRQPWRFLVMANPVHIGELAVAIRAELNLKLQELPTVAAGYVQELEHHATLFSGAPLLILVLHKRPLSMAAPLLVGVHNPDLVLGEPLSAAMAVQNLLLAAHALGLGACVMTAPLLVPEAITRQVTLPAGFELTCLIALGYPAEAPTAPRRKCLAQIVEYLDDDLQHNHEGE